MGITMPRTLGYHVVKSGYGLWLPGDERGHWSAAWDDQIGFYEPHMLHAGDPVRERIAQERMKHPPVVFDRRMLDVIGEAIGGCVSRSAGDLRIVALGLNPTHVHLLIRYTSRDIDVTLKWIADQTTKAVHRKTEHQGPVWAKGAWRGYIFNRRHWENAISYIEAHNVRRGDAARPYAWIEG